MQECSTVGIAVCTGEQKYKSAYGDHVVMVVA